MPSSHTLLAVTDWSTSEFVRGLSPALAAEAAAQGWEVEWFEAGKFNLAERIELLQQAASRGDLAAVMYVHLQLTPEQAGIFQSRRLPVGFLAGKLDGVDWVAGDEAGGGALVAKHLAKLGHRRAGILSGPEGTPECREREAGFMEQAAESGMSVGEDSIVRATGFGPREGYAAARSLLGQTPAPTAVFVAAGDLSALGLVQAARERGLRLPQDLSIVGYDDLAVCERIDPPLSSVRPPLPDMAERLVQALAQGLPGQGRRAPLNLELAPKLVERKSCAVPPA